MKKELTETQEKIIEVIDTLQDSFSCPDYIADRIIKISNSLKDLLLYKNEKYGNSALEPAHIFYKGDAVSSIFVRLDDKLNRVKNGEELRVNDIADIIGYLILGLVRLEMDGKDVIGQIQKEKD